MNRDKLSEIITAMILVWIVVMIITVVTYFVGRVIGFW